MNYCETLYISTVHSFWCVPNLVDKILLWHETLFPRPTKNLHMLYNGMSMHWPLHVQYTCMYADLLHALIHVCMRPLHTLHTGDVVCSLRSGLKYEVSDLGILQMKEVPLMKL